MAQDPDGNSNGSGQGPHQHYQEERLTALEGDAVDAKLELAKQRLTLEYLGEKVAQGFESMGEKLEQGLHPLAQRIGEQAQVVQAIKETLGQQGRGLEEFQEIRKRSRERWGACKKGLLAVLVAGGGVGIKELVVFLAHSVR